VVQSDDPAGGVMANTVPAPGRLVPCERCPLRPLHAFRDFSPEELAFVSEFKSGELTAEPGTTLFMQGTNSAHLYTLLSGWAFRYTTLPDGRRQILNFAFPGEFLGLQGSVINEMQHSVEVLTQAVLCVFPRDKLWELYTRYPSLAFDITWLAAREEQLLDEHLLSVGRRSALERMAFILLHLYHRAEDVDLAKDRKVLFPFTQQHIADTLGMSLVHANKTLRRLYNMKVVRWQERTFEILDQDRLAEIAMFDASDKKPRPLI
jgi:CRP/FNR family transcriptional regulator, anaerobic regulatory protein